MTQPSPRACPRCGTPFVPGQRFCSNCGATADDQAVDPTRFSDEGHAASNPVPPTQVTPQYMTPPPPPQDPYSGGNVSGPPQYPSYAGSTEQNYTNYTPGQMAQNSPGYVPPYAQPVKDSSRKVFGQIGCGFLVVVLLILSVCGVTGYIGYHWLTNLNPNAGNTSLTPGTNNNTTNNGAPAPVTTTALGSSFIYKGVSLTIINAQQATSFGDDSYSSSPIVRLNIKEQNSSNKDVYISTTSEAHLVLPDGSVVQPTNSVTVGSVAQAVVQSGWIDFPVSGKQNVSQLTLRMGANDDAQMNIPLKVNPDLSQYSPKTVTLNKVVPYSGLSWTIQSASRSWSYAATQAKSGTRFVVLKLKVDNQSANEFIGYYGSYMRLQAGNTTSTPTTDSEFPTSIAANSSGTLGTMIFVVPDNVTSYTLILLKNDSSSPPANQVTATFTI